jgi:hypothetical protein
MSASAAAVMIIATIANKGFVAASLVICEYIGVNDLSAGSKR